MIVELEDPYLAARHRMVSAQLEGRGIRDPFVLEAFERVPRHRFVPDSARHQAYEDHPLEIGQGQTISQPYIVACMTEALGRLSGARVLEVGTGSGYQTAILAELAREVHTVERVPLLAAGAREVLDGLGCHNVRFHTGDGSAGLPQDAPFDGILVTAAAPRVPDPLLAQLADGGTLVVPVGPRRMQTLVAVTRRQKKFRKRRLCNCLFVSLVGEEGWES